MLLYFCHSSRNQLCSKRKKPFIVGCWRNNLIFCTRRKPILNVLARRIEQPVPACRSSDGVWVKPRGDPANDTPALPWLRVRRGRFGSVRNA
jgi:hypothetical protein